jgi:general secretion pathway protein M
MNEQWQKIKEWYEQLAIREKRAVTFGGIALGIFLIYAVIWSPLNTSAQNARVHLAEKQKTLRWMQAADQQIQAASGAVLQQNKIDTPVALLSFLQEKINKAGLSSYLSNLKQTNTDAISLSFQKIGFDKLMQFMINMLKEQPMTVTALSVTPSDTLGMVNVDMTVSV